MLIEEHKEMMRLRDQAHEVIRLRAEIENFRRKLHRLEPSAHE
jgi:hypothetical protein